MDVRIDDRTMHEVYLWPFADAVRAGVGSVMCSYNKINGTYACENEWIQNYLLKGELGFKGFIMSDWGAQHTTLGSALSGLDMAMPGDGGPLPYRAWWGGALTEAVLRGDVPQWRLDDMAMRIMVTYFRIISNSTSSRPSGGPNFSAWTNQTFGPLYPASNTSWAEVNKHVNVQADHAEIIREIAAKSTVLLKNSRSLLPLSSNISSIAVIGNDAQSWNPNSCSERACIPRPGTVAMGYGSGTADFPYLVSPASAISARCSSLSISFSNTTSNWDLPTATSRASNASVAIVFVAATAGENFVSIDGNVGDRNNLTLWDNGDALIRAVASVNPNTIVVLHTPGPVLLEYASTHPNVSAILWAGFPGQESGNGIADILFGDVEPQGRTPFTWAAKEEDYGPVDIIYKVEDPKNPSQTFPEGALIDYRWFTQRNLTPVWEFGFGLSYTQFNYSNLQITKMLIPEPHELKKETGPAPAFGVVSKNLSAHAAPEGFQRITPYVYPWLNTTTGFVTSNTSIADFPASARNGSSQQILPAGGGQGGNPELYEVLYVVTVEIENVGERKGVEIVQLVSFFFFIIIFSFEPSQKNPLSPSPLLPFSTFKTPLLPFIFFFLFFFGVPFFFFFWSSY